MAKKTGLRKPQKRGAGRTLFWITLLVCTAALGWWLFNSFDSITSRFGDTQDHEASVGGAAAVRGTVFDRNYKQLAVSLPRVSVYVRTRELKGAEEVAIQLAPILDLDENRLLESLRGDGLRIWLKKNISQEQEETIRELNLPGVYFHRDHSRFYPQTTTAAHLVGFVEDEIGLAGVEYYYDRLIKRSAAINDVVDSPGIGGRDILLTIDLKVQVILEELARKTASVRPGSRVGIYALDTTGGAMVAAVQYPTFNPNTYRLYSQDILAGLLLKPMLVPDNFRRLLRDAASLKAQHDARGSLVPWSIAPLAQSLGTELRLWEDLKLDSRPSTEFAAEAAIWQNGAAFYRRERSGHHDFGTVPEMLTPLNLLVGLSTMLNGGISVEPHVVSAVVDAESGKEFSLRKGEKGDSGAVLAAELSREVSSMLAAMSGENEIGGTVMEGAVRAHGKIAEDWAQELNELYFAAIPLQNAELTILMTVQESGVNVPGKTDTESFDPGAGLEMVLPRIAVLQQVGKTISDVAEPQAIEQNFPAQLDSIREALRSSLYPQAEETVKTGVMPDLTGLSLRKSLRLLQGSGCRIRVFGTGSVVSHKPGAGEKITAETECVLRLQQEEMSLERYEQGRSK